MSTTLFVGQGLPLSIAFLDQAAKLMPGTPDQTPTWATSAPGPDVLTVAGDGLAATFKAVDLGDDILTLTVVAGGKTFSASLDITVVAAPQVLTSVEIVAGTPA